MVSEGADSSSIGHGPGDLHDGRVKSIGSGPISAPLTITSIGDSDSSSDISMSPETDDEEGQSQNIIRVNESSQPIRHPSISISNDEKQESRKRKHTGPAEDVTSNYIGIGLQPEVHKRRRPEDFARMVCRPVEPHQKEIGLNYPLGFGRECLCSALQYH